MAKRKEKPPEEGAPAWMATFSDLMNLLLCFFVLLFASSTMDAGKIQKIAASFDNMSFSILNNGAQSLINGEMMSGGVTQLPETKTYLQQQGETAEGNEGNTGGGATRTDAKLDEVSNAELKAEYDERGEKESQEMYDEIVSMSESYNIESLVTIDYTKQYVELELNGSILFESGSAEVKDDSKMFLQKIASILTKYKYNIIEIEGHTDNVPITGGGAFSDNRALSMARAKSVYDFVITQENFIDENMKIAGYGESRPVASNATPEGRARNRRVSIKIYNEQNSN
ncbi:MAG: flagellar motor protein MotB [Lachnospiraceae bacterium]|nr:flagellar motor protein MotB [Lachnospiraceae bacterium]